MGDSVEDNGSIKETDIPALYFSTVKQEFESNETYEEDEEDYDDYWATQSDENDDPVSYYEDVDNDEWEDYEEVEGEEAEEEETIGSDSSLGIDRALLGITDSQIEFKINEALTKKACEMEKKTGPSNVMGYFLKMLLTNQVRTKEEEEEHRRLLGTGTTDAEEEEEGGSEEEENEGEDEEEGGEYLQLDGDFLQIDTSGGKRIQVIDDQKDTFMKKEFDPRKCESIASGEKIAPEVHRRWSRTLWRKEIENLEPEYRLPTLIHKKFRYIREQEPTRIGPGTYETYEYEKIQKEKRFKQTKGQMYSCTRRFPKEKMANDNPGPGAYGYSQDVLENSRLNKKLGLFQSGGCSVRGNTFKEIGSGVAPGQYEIKPYLDTFLQQQTSIRGPYDLYTPPRNVIPYGYYKSNREKYNLGPGQYTIRKTLKQELNESSNKFKGVFRPHPRSMKYTGERVTLVSPLWAVANDEPGPGAYEIEPFKKELKQNKHAFLTSGKLARPREVGDYDMAPDKYRPEKGPVYHPLGDGFVSNFRSTAGRLDPLKIAVLTERLRGKDIPPNLRHKVNMEKNEDKDVSKIFCTG